MKRNEVHLPLATACAMLVVILFAMSTRAIAQKESTIYNLGAGDCANLQAGVTADSSGNLYAASSEFVCEFIQAGGTWTEKTLYEFTTDEEALGGLTLDATGNLYGPTIAGRTGDAGTIFKLTPTASGEWTEEILFTFPLGGARGNSPYGKPVFDGAGNLYGTTAYGGTYGTQAGSIGGTVFELIPQPSGPWKEKVLHSFGNGADGAALYGGVIFDSAGNLYGVTNLGGTFGEGIAFELTPHSNGTWTETILHNFGSGTDGQQPYYSLVSDSAGNLYGTTNGGGTNGVGTAYELIRQAGGGWEEKILNNFSAMSFPFAPLIFDHAGDLYSTTFSGGHFNGGTAYELVPHSKNWKEKVIHNFGNGSDGSGPLSYLGIDAAGNIYGATLTGGTSNDGTLFEITP